MQLCLKTHLLLIAVFISTVIDLTFCRLVNEYSSTLQVQENYGNTDTFLTGMDNHINYENGYRSLQENNNENTNTQSSTLDEPSEVPTTEKKSTKSNQGGSRGVNVKVVIAFTTVGVILFGFICYCCYTRYQRHRYLRLEEEHSMGTKLHNGEYVVMPETNSQNTASKMIELRNAQSA